MDENRNVQDVIQEGSREDEETEEDDAKELESGFDASKVQIGFNLRKKVPFGSAVYVIGGIPLLGNWVTSKALRLNWSEGHVWHGSLKMRPSHLTDLTFKYKYFISDFEMQPDSSIVWEPGMNRTFFASWKYKFEIHVDDTWGLIKITFRLALNDSIHSVYLAAGHPSIGYDEAHPARMYQRILRETFAGGAHYWEKELEIPSELEKVDYRYGLKPRKISLIRWERESNRIFNLKDAKYYVDAEFDSFRDTIGVKMDQTSFTYKNSLYIRMDHEFIDDFIFSEVSSNLWVGPYPKYEEIVKLRPNGCNCIVNLQTNLELEGLILSAEQYEEVCKKTGIHFYHCPISTPDFTSEEVYAAAKLLDQCIDKYKRVYVHCTNGLNRSVAVAILYYHLFKELPVRKAIEAVVSKRWRSTISEEQINQLLRGIKSCPRPLKGARMLRP